MVVDAGQRFLVLDDKRLGPASFFSFSPDSTFLAHAVPVGEAKFHLGLNGIAVGVAFDAAPPGARVIWESPTTARMIAGRGTDMLMVKLNVSK
jgi:hypothetical protein